MPTLGFSVKVRQEGDDVKREVGELPARFDVALARGASRGVDIYVQSGVDWMGRQPQNARAAFNTKAEGTRGEVELASGEAGDIAGWMATGTGLYGPRMHRIVPIKAKALVFEWQGRRFVRRSVRGMRGNEWPEKAWAQALPRIKEAYEQEVADVVRGGVPV